MSAPAPSKVPHPAIVAVGIGLLARLLLIALVPENFSFDAYQRWAGREHLLVQDWLPAPQAILWLTHALGGGIIAARIIFSVVGAVAAGAGAFVATQLGGREAGWAFVPISLFGPFLVWSTVPYQEGCYLALALGGLALALHGRDHGRRWFVLADLCMGALALVRYEGWPLIVLYMLWRRDPRALLAAWGMGLWLALKLGVGVEGYAASPVDFADWDGLVERIGPRRTKRTLMKLGHQVVNSGAWVLIVCGGVGAVDCIRHRRPAALLLALAIAGQGAAVVGWMAGLETATYRMQAIIGVLGGIFAAYWAGAAWRAQGRPVRMAGLVGALLLSTWYAYDSFWTAERSVRSVQWEISLVERMSACPTCTWVVVPRRRLGTRNRHDGCEVIQGVSNMLAGRDFYCSSWWDEPATDGTHFAVNVPGGYRISTADGSGQTEVVRPPQ